MKNVITKSESSQPVGETAVYLFDDWFDPIEAGVRDRVRGFIQAMIEGELDETLMRPRYGRRLASSSGKDDGLAAITGHRHGHRSRSLTGSFGRTEIAVPGAACWRRRQDHGMEEQGIADLSAPYAGCRCLDRVGLLGGHQYAPCPPCAQGTVC
jgi:hypothetical protein